tara:strand:- start:247 stop:1980 length:1734 start_codon:yes stop_codon:yes gene_type:complete
MEETLAKDYANRFPDKFQSEINDKDEHGQAKYYIDVTDDDGTTRRITWSDRKTVAEATMIMKDFNLKNGYQPISHYRKEFATDVFWTNIQNAQTKIIDGVRAENKELLAQESLQFRKSAIVVAAQSSPQDLVKILQDLEINEASQLGGTRQTARTYLNDFVLDLYRQGDITYDQARGVITGTFLRNDGSVQPLTSFKEYEDFQTKLQNIHTGKAQEENSRISAFGLEFTDRTIKGLEETDTVLTEAILAEAKNAFKAEFQEVFGRVPEETEYPKKLLNMITVEDQNDSDIVSILEAKKAANEPILYQDFARIVDPVLRKKWSDYSKTAAGSGMTNEDHATRNENLPAIVTGVISETLGPTGPTKSRSYLKLYPKAERLYNIEYSNLVDQFEQSGEGRLKLHDEIIRRITPKLKEIHVNNLSENPNDTTDKNRFRIDVNEGRTFIQNSRKDLSINEIFQSDLIPGSKSHYDRLVNGYAKSPRINRIPPYYYELARPYKNIDAWDIANMQYFSQTGKELPKPNYKTVMENFSALSQYYLKTKPNNKTKIKVDIIEKENGDFNGYSLRPELVERLQGAFL